MGSAAPVATDSQVRPLGVLPEIKLLLFVVVGALKMAAEPILAPTQRIATSPQSRIFIRLFLQKVQVGRRETIPSSNQIEKTEDEVAPVMQSIFQ
jgi:hypothetical protein